MIRFNPILASLDAYVPGEQPRDGQYVKLNTNECPYPAAPEVVESIQEALAQNVLQKYPDPTAFELRSALADRLGVSSDWILVGNGSDEVLRLICHALLSPGEMIGMLYPTYVLYRTLAAMFGAGCDEFDVMEPDYAIPEALESAAMKILFVANPNPPYGTLYALEDIERLVQAQPERLVVVDEAYIDFAQAPTAIRLVKHYPNIAVTRTFSKSYALAGMRVGFVVAQRPVIQQLEKLKDSYNVNLLSLRAALAALQAKEYYKRIISEICKTRAFLTAELERRGFVVPKSAGNFVFARREGAAELYQRLKAQKILVRYFDARLLRDGVRITVGTPAEISALLEAIDRLDGR